MKSANDQPANSATSTAGEIAKDRADWLLDAIAAATQNKRYLRGEPECDDFECRAILASAEKAILVAIARSMKAPAAPSPSTDPVANADETHKEMQE